MAAKKPNTTVTLTTIAKALGSARATQDSNESTLAEYVAGHYSDRTVANKKGRAEFLSAWLEGRGLTPAQVKRAMGEGRADGAEFKAVYNVAYATWGRALARAFGKTVKGAANSGNKPGAAPSTPTKPDSAPAVTFESMLADHASPKLAKLLMESVFNRSSADQDKVAAELVDVLAELFPATTRQRKRA